MSNNMEEWCAVCTGSRGVSYNQGAEVRVGERLISTEQAGNLLATRDLESAATLTQLIVTLVD